MDLAEIALQLISSKFGGKMDSSADSSVIMKALTSLLGGGNGSLDLSSLISTMSSGNLMGMVQSFLGDGANDKMSANQVMELLGSDKVTQFASSLGLSTNTAAEGLSDIIPELIDKSSSGGSLLDSVGGVGGLMGMAGKLFK